MPNVLDDNVVILRFDNSDFEKNTKQSMDTLDKLKNSVDKTSGESLGGLGKAANSINLSGLGKAIDTINSRFSLMGVAGMAAINKLTSAAMSSVSNIVTTVPRQMIQGGWKRALNIEQATYLMKGLGVEFQGTFDKYTGAFEGVKGAVLASVNDTRYGLDEAAKAAATLIASGIKDTNELADRLKAISGVAAVTSSEYNEIAYIFTKVAGQGRMMGDELNQLSNKGFNAAVEIANYLNKNAKVKDQALDNAIALGKQSTKMKEIKEHAEVTEADVREMVSAGAISFDIMSNSMLHFFDTAAGANETFEGSLANVKAAFSRMGAQVEATKLQNLTKIFNYLLPVLKRFEDFIEPFTAKINKFSTKVSDFIGEGIINPLGKAIGAKPEDLFHGFKKAAEDAAKGVEGSNDKVQQSANKTSKEILSLNKEYQAARDIWYKGTYGRGSKRADALEKIGISYKGTQAIINQFYKDGFKWDKIEKQLIKDYQDKATANNESANAANNAADATEKQTQKYPTMVALVKSFVNLTASAALTLEGFKNILVAIGGAIKKIITPGLRTGANGFEKLSSKILAAAKRFNEFSKIITDGEKRAKWLEDHKGISSFLNALSTGIITVKNVISNFVTTIKEFFSQFSESEGFALLKEQLLDLIDVLKDLAGGTLDKVTNQLGKLSDIGASSNMSKVVGFFSNLSAGLADMIANIRRGENPFKNFTSIFGKVKEALSFKSLSSQGISASVNVLSAKNGVIGAMVNASNEIKKANIPQTFNNASESIFNFFSGLTSKVKGIDVKGTLDKVLDAFMNADWSEISKIVLRIGSLVAVFKTVRDMSRLVDAAVGTLGSISGFFGSLSNVANTYAGSIKAKNFQMIAISVAILIGSIVALAAVPTERLIPAMSGVIVLVGMMVGVMALMTSKKFDPTQVYQVGIAFAAMGASIMLLATACKLLASINGEGLLKAGMAITVFMGMFVLAARMKGEIMKSGTAFLAMAGAINLLVFAVGAFAVMPWGAILKGATAIGILMTELVIAGRIAGMSNPGGLLAMAAALDLLIPAIVVFSIMPAEQALKGAVVTCTILAMIGLASRTAGKNAGNMLSLVGMATMVVALSAALVALSMIDGNRLAMAATALVTTMLSLAIAAGIASSSKAGLAMLSLAIVAISASIISLIKIDAESAIKVANSLAVLAASLSVAFGIFSLIGVKGSLTGLGGLSIAIGGITAIIMALGAIRQIPGAEWLIKEGRKFAEQLGGAIGGFVGSIVGGFAAGATSGLSTMAKNLTDFANNIGPFIDMAGKITPESAKGVKNLSTAIVELSKAELIDSLSSFSGFGDMAKKMAELGEGFVEFSKTVDSIPEDTADKSAKIANIISTLAKSFGNIPKSNGLAQVFTGYADIDLFVDGMLKFAKALGKNGMSKGLADLEIPDDLLGENGKITKIVDVMNVMSKAAKKIPKSGGVQQAFTGNTTLDEFAEQLASFASNLPTILATLSAVEIPDGFVGEGGKIDKLCQIMGQLSKSAAEIPPSMGIKQIITGNTTISEFALMLAAAVPGISHFIDSAQNINLDDESLGKVRNVARAVKAMALASQELPETGGFKQVLFGGQEINTFAKQLAAAIPGLQTFTNGIKDVKIDNGVLSKVPKVAEAIAAMAEVAKALPKSGGVWQRLTGQKDIGSFGKQLGKLINSLGPDNIKGTINSGAIKSAADAINTITPAVQTFKSAMPIPTGANLAKLGENAASFVESLGSTNTKGITSKASAISSASKKLAESASKGVSSSAKNTNLSSSGSSIATSFLNGIKNKLGAASTAGKNLANKIKSGANGVSLYSVGQSVGQGFVRGINSKQQAAYNAGSALGYKAKAGAKNAVNSNSPAKEFIKIGNYSGEGLVIGLKAYERKVYKAGYSMGAMSVEGSNDGIDSILMDISEPVITPVLDLSEVDRGLNTLNNEFSQNRAFGINSTFQSNDYKTNKMMNDMVTALNKMNESPTPIPNNITVNVDGTENPEAFAQRFVRQVQLEMRAV